MQIKQQHLFFIAENLDSYVKGDNMKNILYIVMKYSISCHGGYSWAHD